MKKRNEGRLIWIYLFTCFALSILISAIVGFTGGHLSRFAGIGYLTMFIPAFALASINLLGEPIPMAGWNNFSGKWFLLALFFFPVLIHAFCLPVIAFQHDNSIPWQSWLKPDIDGLYHAPAGRNWGTMTRTGLIFHLLLNALVGLIVISVFAFFEEIGWRAWLLPKLIGRYQLKKGLLISAAICALWHIPFILGGIHYIENAPLSAVVLFFTFGQLGVGLILGWFWIRTRSIWIVSLAHGSLNDWGQYAFKFMNNSNTSRESVSLIIALNISLLLAGLVLLARVKERQLLSEKYQL